MGIVVEGTSVLAVSAASMFQNVFRGGMHLPLLSEQLFVGNLIKATSR
jgi:hypothetical protein